jgi:hypothetical protein
MDETEPWRDKIGGNLGVFVCFRGRDRGVNRTFSMQSDSLANLIWSRPHGMISSLRAPDYLKFFAISHI